MSPSGENLSVILLSASPLVVSTTAGWLSPLPGPFDRFLGGHPVDMSALGAFEDPQIRTIATWFDAGQHHATLARRAEWP
jgi:hypothetical protein